MIEWLVHPVRIVELTRGVEPPSDHEVRKEGAQRALRRAIKQAQHRCRRLLQDAAHQLAESAARVRDARSACSLCGARALTQLLGARNHIVWEIV